MNEPTMYPTTTRPDFFTSDYFTIFISSEPAVWIYGARIISISKHTPRMRITDVTPLERTYKALLNSPKSSYKKARFPINGADNGKGHFSVYSNGFAVDVQVSANIMINDPYVKQKIEEHYTFNYPPTKTKTP